jgi:16S rRNA (uracil1498-N3)-methyltransferase
MMKPPVGTVPRFLAPDLDPAARVVTLPEDEARHLAKVLRLRPGDAVRVFDGRGHEFVAAVASARAGAVMLELGERVEPAVESPVPLTLVQGVLKGEAMETVVRDATMMGVTRIEPVTSAHVAVRPVRAGQAGQIERWRRIAVASAKQSRRATVPDVAGPVPLATAIAGLGTLALLFVEPAAARESAPLREILTAPRPASASLIIGPEGGWASGEVEAFVAAGARPVTLGQLTLRADAMPVAALAIVRWMWEGEGGAQDQGSGIRDQGSGIRD